MTLLLSKSDREGRDLHNVWKRAWSWDTFGALAGVLSVVLGIGSYLAEGCLDCLVAINDPPEAFAQIYGAQWSRLRLTVYLELLSTFFFVVFTSYLGDYLRKAAGGVGWLASVAYGGGILTAAVDLLWVSFIIAGATVGEYGASPEVARTLFILTYNFDYLSAPPLAAIVGATSVVILRTGLWPRWLGWVGLLIAAFALALITGGVTTVPAILWLLLVSILMVSKQLRAQA
jgi:hypothetical protein